MSRQCPNCGNFLLENERFCTRCGANINDTAQPAPEQPAAYQQQPNNNVPPVPPYTAPQPQPQAQPQYNYNYTYNQQVPQEKPMTTGQWVGTIIVTTWFGIISLIITLVWAFSDSTNTSKKNYCRAVLIIDLIGVGLCILTLLILFATGFSIANSIANSSYYYQ